MLQKKLKILLIENNKIEIIKFKRAISSDFSDFTIFVANNGSEAVSLLENSFPDIILLDLNMPETNGIEFLKMVKNNSNLNHIPIVVLTTSSNIKDIQECYKLGVASYVLKSLKYEDYKLEVNAIIKYWSLNEFIEK
ncbi:response regulator [Polaribacter glomeratus]|uniref:Response regulator n=1 Tax=Polaribacter glomeratus TaxID=102 RepID=A0A2S7WWP5_9FLAO|nr:response regulator [Polaribacter glomeratus]PQJ82020.1 response regulator [Polaribacter glomeratus]TXD66613.1 response regulator [Polaribacter glomeratus]